MRENGAGPWEDIVSLPPLVEPAAELTVDEIRRYSRHLIIPDVGGGRAEAAEERQGAVRGRRRSRFAGADVPGRGRRRHARHRRLRHGRRVQPAAPDHPRPERHRPTQGRVRRRVGAGDQPVRQCGHPQHRADQRQRLRDLRPVRPDRRRHRQLRHPLHGQRRRVLLGKPYVWGSIYRFDGQASVFWAEHGPCYRCLYPEPPPPGMVPSCAEGGVLGVLCASIGSIQVTEAIKLLTGIGEPLVGGLMVYDALEMTYRKIKVRKDPNCALCGENPTVTDLHRLRGLLRRGLRRGAAGGAGLDHHRARAQGLAGRRQGHLPGRRPRAGRVRDRQDPRLGADPQGRDPLRRGAGRACRRTGRSCCTASPASAPPRRSPRVKAPASRTPCTSRVACRLGQQIDPSLPAY